MRPVPSCRENGRPYLMSGGHRASESARLDRGRVLTKRATFLTTEEGRFCDEKLIESDNTEPGDH